MLYITILSLTSHFIILSLTLHLFFSLTKRIQYLYKANDILFRRTRMEKTCKIKLPKTPPNKNIKVKRYGFTGNF